MSNSDYIYRIQNAEGIGMYRVDGYARWLFNQNDDEEEATFVADHSNRRPTPTNDPILNDNEFFSRYYFGFKDLKQLENWVGSQAIQHMNEHPDTSIEYRMAIYVFKGGESAIHHGQKQSIMQRDECELIDVIQGHNIHKYSSYGQNGFCRENIK